MRRFLNLGVASLTHATLVVFLSSGANAAVECRTAELQDPNMCQAVCDAIKAANGVAGPLNAFKLHDLEGVTYNTPTNQKLWEQNKASGYASPVKITTCKAEKRRNSKIEGCLITMCGLLPGFRDVKQNIENANKSNLDMGRYTQPKPHVGPPGLLEGDAATDRQGPSATGAPIGPSGGAAPTYSRGGVR
ncbi:MAG: hypothetical protein ACXWKC_11920 [Xanthobacteraceae bacterium]